MSRVFLLTTASVFGLIASASVASANGAPPAFVGPVLVDTIAQASATGGGSLR